MQDGVTFAICCRMRTLLASWWVRLERGVAALNVREGDCAVGCNQKKNRERKRVQDMCAREYGMYV